MKAANSWASLLRGVSQQVPADRSEGQHTEQVNMLSDPVNGLVRRHGSLMIGERWLDTLNAGQFSTYVTDTATWGSFDFDFSGKEYTILYRKKVRPSSANPMPLCLVYNKTDNTFLNTSRYFLDTAMDALEGGGVSAITSVGKYLFMAGNESVVTGTSTPLWDNALNYEKAVVWVRGGAYSRKYTVTVRKQDNTTVSVNYTTPSSSYQGTLDTSGVVYTDPDYTKQVNDIVNAYNSAVTNWIGTSTAAIQPAAIAEELKDLLVAAGVTCSLAGSHICFDHTTPIKSLQVDDGGDGSLIRGVADEIESPDKTSVIHHVGKIVKVRSRNSAEAYYLKAIAKDKAVTTGYTEVTWVEGAGVEHAITGGLFYCTIVGSTCFIASSATIMNTINPGTHPDWLVSTAGDADSAPTPSFIGRKVTYLGTFQNRLLVGSGGALACSKTEDYLNFFRSTVLTLPADDPFEMLPQGSEDDELQASCLYNRDLVVFGKNRQYAISGNTPLTPTSANMPVIGSYEDVVDASPVAAGGYIFYAKRGTSFSSVHQLQPGINDNSPESFPASSQIDSYMLGGAVELASATGTPSILFARTTGYRNGLYVFSYLDKQDGRKMDSWNRWEFNEALGAVMGMSVATDSLIVFTLRVAPDNRVYAVADRCPTITTLADAPYLDSRRSYGDVVAGGSISLASGSNFAAAFDSTSERRFTGTLLPNVGTLLANYPGEPGLQVGAVQEAYFTPTNPFMRDSKGKAILSGRLTVGQVTLAFKESTGFTHTVVYRNVVTDSVEFNGRILGDPNNVIGIEPISTGKRIIPVGRETNDYTMTIAARRWYPLTVTALEWTGQFFNNVQRF